MELLNKLCDINGCSGNESAIAKLIIENIKEFVDDIKTDSLGNIIAHKKGNGKKLMFVTHMDETGFFTTISNDKEIKVATIGEIDVKSLSNTIIQFEGGKTGYLKGESSEKISDYSVELLEENVDLTGKTVIFEPNYKENEKHIISKGLSARLGCFVLINIIKEIKSNFDLYFAFTVKKNIGLKGAKVVAFDANPDYAVVIDCAECKDVSVIAKDKNYIADNLLKQQLEESEFTPVVLKDLLTEGCAIQVTGNGVKTAVTAIPIKCINSRNEIVSKDDIYKITHNLIKFAKKDF